jgi:hypothetical protein
MPTGPLAFSRHAKAPLGDLLEDVGTKMLRYLYDFGEGRERTLKG